MFERIALQAQYASELVYRLRGQSPEIGSTVFKPSETEPPELWEPVTVREVRVVSGNLELVVTDSDGNVEVLSSKEQPYGWADMGLMHQIWGQAILFEIHWPKSTEIFVVDSSTTMNYVPKCKIAIKTGLCYNTVISEITDDNGNQRYTACPHGVEQSHECKYPNCLSVLIDTPQVSITAAKATFRKSCAVALFGKTKNRFLYLTNGNHHLNLVKVDEAIRNAWFSGYLRNLGDAMDILYPEKDWEHRDFLHERLAQLNGEELQRWSEAEARYPSRTTLEEAIDEEKLQVGDNIVFKTKQKKK